MAELTHDLEYDVALDRDAFGKVDGSGKGSDLNMHFTAGSNHRREAAFRCYAGEQELRIELPYLIFNWHEKCDFTCIHLLAPSSSQQIPLLGIQLEEVVADGLM